MKEIIEIIEKKFTQSQREEIVNFYEDIKKYVTDDVTQNYFNCGKEILKILLPIELDESIVMASMLLGFVRKNLISADDLQKYANAVSLAQTVVKIENFKSLNKQEEVENLRSMLVAIAKDIRVIILKLADILNEARHINYLPTEYAKDLHLEITKIYIPLAARLGLSYIKSELQDLNLMYTNPNEYKKLVKKLAEDGRIREKQIEDIIVKLKQVLNGLNIKGEVKGRLKHISSIYIKMNEKNCNLNQIYDLSAVRVIVSSVNDCYTILGEVHSQFAPLDGRFKDYIARPKSNGYQSLHTTVLFNERPIEIQIRTLDMHNLAEYGIAAHWLYKEHKQKFTSLDERLMWIRKLIENPETTTSEELLDELRTDVYSGEIFVQTPLGKIIQLPESATPIDFAYAIHTDVGNKCVGARINSKMVPLNTSLNNGDIVEIITNPNAKGPSRDWLKLAKTSSAKNKINTFFKKELKDDNIKRGKTMLEQAGKNKGVDLSKLMTDEWVHDVLEKYSFNEIDELYAALGFGAINTTQVLNRLIGLYKQKFEEDTIKVVKINESAKEHAQSSIKEFSNMMVKFAHCCNPLPGDEIVGFISRGRGVTIHRADCVSLKNLESDRLMKISWGDYNKSSFVGELKILVKNAQGVLAEISNKIAENKINITAITTEQKKDDTVLIVLKLNISNKSELVDLMNKIKSMPNVINVFRDMKD